MPQTITVRLGAFVENIEGAVVDPNHAIGAPDGVFTGNTDGVWRAKWALEAPESPAIVAKHGVHKVRVHCRRADDAGEDPSIWRVMVRNQQGELVYDFFDGSQLTLPFGAVNLNENRASEGLQKAIIQAFQKSLPDWGTNHRVDNWNDLRGVAFAKDTNELLILVAASNNNQNGWLFKIADFGLPTMYGKSATIPAETGTFARSTAQISNDGKVCAYIGNPSVPMQSYLEVEVSAGDFQLQRITLPAAIASMGNSTVRLSEDGNYCIFTSASDSQVARLLKLDRATKEWADISPPELTSIGQSTSHYRVPSWVGNIIVLPVSDGFRAWIWDAGAEALTPISGVTGGQFPVTISSAISAVSSDGRYAALAFLSSTTKELWIEDLQAPGAGARRTLSLHAASRVVQNLFWLPDDEGVCFINHVTSYANIHPGFGVYFGGSVITVRVPAIGGITYWSSVKESVPLTTKIPVQQIAMNADWVVAVSDGSSAAICADSPIHVWARPDPLRSKDIFEMRAMWDLLFKPFTPADIRGFQINTSTFVQDRPHRDANAQNGMLNNFSKTGKYWCAVSSGGAGYLHRNEFDLPRLAREYKSTFLGQIAISDSPHMRWDFSADDVYFAANSRVRQINDDGVTVTFTEPDGAPAYNSTWKQPLFRSGAAPEDPYRNLYLNSANTSPFLRVYNFVGSTAESLTDWWVSPTGGWLGLPVDWSPDGQYVLFRTASTINVIRFDPNLATGFAFMGSSGGGNWNTTQWHPKAPHTCLRFQNSNWPSYIGTVTFHTIENDALVQIPSQGTSDVIMAAGNGNNLAAVTFTPDGRYFIAWFYQPGYEGDAPHIAAVFEWDESKLDAGLVRVPLDGVESFMGVAGRKLGLVIGNEHYRLYPAPMPLGATTFAAFGQHHVNTMFADPEIDWDGLIYDAGWTVEIETWGDDNAVQLEAVELELQVNLFNYDPPWNRQTSQITGASARTSWDWSPDGEPEP